MEILPEKILMAIVDELPKKKSKKGRPEECRLKIIRGIFFILKTGSQWVLLPNEYGKRSTVHGRFMEWCRSGAWNRAFEAIRERYDKIYPEINWYAIDTSSRKAPFAKDGGKNPTDRAKRGLKHVLVVDRKGVPVLANIAPANRHDTKIFEPIIDRIGTQKRTLILAADSAFDVERFYKKCTEKNIALIATPRNKRNQKVHKFRVVHRWIIEQTFGILSWFRGLKTCWAKTTESALGFLHFACLVRILRAI